MGDDNATETIHGDEKNCEFDSDGRPWNDGKLRQGDQHGKTAMQVFRLECCVDPYHSYPPLMTRQVMMMDDDEGCDCYCDCDDNHPVMTQQMHSLSKNPVDCFQEKKKMVAMSPSPVHMRQVVPSDLWEQFVEDYAKATKIVVVGKNRCRRNHFHPHRVVQM